MDDIKLVAKNEKVGNSNTGSENIHLRYRVLIRHRKRCHAYNEKQETVNNGRNRISKPRKN